MLYIIGSRISGYIGKRKRNMVISRMKISKLKRSYRIMIVKLNNRNNRM